MLANILVTWDFINTKALLKRFHNHLLLDGKDVLHKPKPVKNIFAHCPETVLTLR